MCIASMLCLICCCSIKPNHTKRPLDFNDEYIGHQVQYLGLEENIRVRRAGYADKIDYYRFQNRCAACLALVWS